MIRKRTLGRTGLAVPPIGFGGAVLGYVNRANDWDPYSAAGRRDAIAAIHHGLDRGVSYIDTAPLYGDGHSESLIGEVMRTRRQDCVLATKIWYEGDRQASIDSVHASLKRLRTDHIDIVQIHGRRYTPADIEHVVHGGPLDGLREMRAAGKIGFIGLTTDEPWSAIPFLDVSDIDVYQVAYNFIQQSAALHFLVAAARANVGVVSMRTMTSGVLQLTARHLAPEWQAAHDLYDVCLKFVLSDSRVHAALVGMRWRGEVDRNAAIAESWVPPVDFAALPRLTGDIYKAEDSG